MINKRRKKHFKYLYRMIDIPAMVIFLTIITIYTITGNAGHSYNNNVQTPSIETNTPIDTTAASASADDENSISVTASALPDHLTPVSDSELDKLSSVTVSVLLSSGSVANVPLETYVARVVASEMPSSFSYEALKAQAVAARTYVEGRRIQFADGKSKHKEACVCASTCCQVYRSEAELRSVKSDEWYENDFNIIKNAVLDTAGEMLYYNGELVQQPLFFSSAGGGKTENSEDVFTGTLPYLRSVDSLYDSPEKYTNKVSSIPLSEVISKVNDYAASHSSAVTIISDSDASATTVASDSTIEILSRTEGGGAALVRFGSIALTGRQVRSIFDLPSADMDVSSANGSVTFTTRGSGHRVGLSQYGADGMASHGYTYKEILSHYYSGTEVRSAR